MKRLGIWSLSLLGISFLFLSIAIPIVQREIDNKQSLKSIISFNQQQYIQKHSEYDGFYIR
jgi:hypothetical protein